MSANPSPSRVAAQPAVERQDPFSRGPRRHRLSPGRHGQERRAEETFKAADHLSQETSIVVTGTVREDKRAKGGYEIDRDTRWICGTGTGLPHHAQGARRRLPDRSPASLDPCRTADCDSQMRHEVINAVRDFSTAMDSSSPIRRFSRQRRARARQRCSRCSTSTTPRRI